jgi:hypothetical protein
MKTEIPERNIETLGVTQEKKYNIKLGAHTMMLFSDLYSDPYWAIAREYATNMLDGYTKLRKLNPNAKIVPPEIHLPNTLSPFIRFKDYGTGMSFETVWEVFTSYGASTKQDNNDEVGGLGIGSKVAFAYRGADQWIIESRFNGQFMTFNALKDREGIPTLQHIDTRPTDEPNGVTIQIPVARQDFDRFRVAVQRVAEFYPMALTVSGSAAYQKPTPTYKHKGTAWGLRSIGDSRIIMGNIPYPLNVHQLSGDSNAISYVRSHGGLDLILPVGSVGIVPSREALLYSEQTKETVVAAIESVFEELLERVAQSIQNSKTKWEAIEALYEASETANLRPYMGNKVLWQGQPIGVSGLTIDTTEGFDDFPDLTIEKYANERGKTVFYRSATQVVELHPGSDEWVFIDDTGKYNGPVRRVRGMMGDKLITTQSWGRKKYAQGTGKTYVFRAAGLTPAKLSELLGGFPVEYVSTLSEPVVVRNSTGAPKKRTSVKLFDFRAPENWRDTDVDVEEGGYYIRLEGGAVQGTLSEWSLNQLLVAATALGSLPEDFQLYGIPRSRANIEKKEGWTEFSEWYKPQAQRIVAQLAKDYVDVSKWNPAIENTLTEFCMDGEVIAAVIVAKPRSPMLKLAEAGKAIMKKAERTAYIENFTKAFNLPIPKHASKENPDALIKEVRTKHPTLALMVDLAESSYNPVIKLKEHLPILIKLLSVS